MITYALTGDDKVWNNLNLLGAKIKDKFLRKAMKTTLAPILSAAQATCPEDLGILKESLDTKITTLGATKGTLIVGIMGPRTRVRVPVRIIKRGPRKGQQLIAIPTKYAKNVEFGHNIVVDGKVVGRVGPRAFMRPAWDEFGAEVAVYTFADSMQEQINNELAAI